VPENGAAAMESLFASWFFSRFPAAQQRIHASLACSILRRVCRMWFFFGSPAAAELGVYIEARVYSLARPSTLAYRKKATVQFLNDMWPPWG